MEPRLRLSDLPPDVLFSICYNLSRTSLAYAARVNKSFRDVCQYLLEHKRKIRLVDDNLNVLFSGLGPLSGLTSCMKNLYRMCLTLPEEPTRILPKYKRKLIITRSSLSRRNRLQTITLFEGRNEYLLRAFQADVCVLVYGAYDKFEDNIDVNKIVSICHMMSSRDIIVAINLDSSSQNTEKVFYEKRNYLSEILNKAIGPCFEIIPVDAIRGTNLNRTGAKFDWFRGDSLLTLLHMSQNQTNYDENFVERLRKQIMQIHLYDMLPHDRRDNTYVCLGRVMSGTVRVGDQVYLSQHGIQTKVHSIEMQCKSMDHAVAGDFVGIKLGNFNEFYRGHYEPNKEILIPNNFTSLTYTVAFRCKFVVLDSSMLNELRSYKLYYAGLRTQCKLVWIFPQKKYQKKKDIKNLKVFTGIMWASSRVFIQPFKASEFQKNYVGKVLLAEKHHPIAIGRVDKVFNMTTERSKLHNYRYRSSHAELEALQKLSRPHLFNPDETHLAEKFEEAISEKNNPYWSLVYSS